VLRHVLIIFYYNRQRKRELDFQRTIGNYRKSIDTLIQEKNSLLALQEGGEGEKKNAIVASQKALAQAAQSVADAALARKREANATFHLIDARVKSHLAERLEQFLPQNLASSEVSAVKGELLLSKIAMKSSLSLNTLSEIFEKLITTANTNLGDIDQTQYSVVDKIEMTSNLSQQVGIISHQTKFAKLAIDVSSECLRLLSFSQWPEMLSPDASVHFSIAVSQSIPELDATISEQLLRLKEEGVLSPHQSNLSPLTQALQKVRASLDDILDENENPMVPQEWEPQTLSILNRLSLSKYACLGSASILASLVSADGSVQDPQKRCAFISTMFEKMYHLCKQIQSVTDYLGLLHNGNEDVNHSLSQCVLDLSTNSWDLFSFIEALFSKNEISVSDINEVQSKILKTSNVAGKLLTSLRSQKRGNIEESKVEEILSPETSDPWEAVKTVATKVRSTTDAMDEINYIRRGRKLEEQLSAAIENNAKLLIANSKIRNLEKNLANRSKEISMQNSRLIELEDMLSKTTTFAAKTQATTSQPLGDSKELKEEIRVLNEAMEVLQTQVDEYEREIRSLKDPQKGKGRRAPGSARKGANTDTSDFSLSSLGSVTGSSQKPHSQDVSTGLIEAAFFRPVLHSARSDAAVWKSKTIAEALQKLPPLSATVEREISDLKAEKQKLLMANAELRRSRASVSIIDIGSGLDKSSMLRFKEERQNITNAVERLQVVSSSIRFKLCSKLM
jgi:hypothetical protein